MSKECQKCGIVFEDDYSVDGATYLCETCRNEDAKRQQRNAKARSRARQRKIVYDSLGLKKVIGALGGIYYE